MNLWFYARLVGCLAAGALVLPAASLSQSRACTSGALTPQSYTWNFRQEAQGLLGDVDLDAYWASYHADQLDHFSPEISWEEHAIELNAIRGEINDMGTKLCRLETIRRVVSPWEQKAIDNAAPLIAEMANEAASAITYLNNSQLHLFAPSYHAYSEEMFQQSTRLNHQLNQFEDFSKVHRQDIRLEKSLGLMKKS